MIGTSLSASKSNTMKSTGKINLSTFTNTSSIFPSGYAWDLSASCKETVVGLHSPTPNYLNTDKGMRLMLAPRSQSALPLYLVLMEHGIVKLPGSFIFCGILLWSIRLHSCVRAIVSNSPSLLFFVNISLSRYFLSRFALELPQKGY